MYQEHFEEHSPFTWARHQQLIIPVMLTSGRPGCSRPASGSRPAVAGRCRTADTSDFTLSKSNTLKMFLKFRQPACDALAAYNNGGEVKARVLVQPVLSGMWRQAVRVGSTDVAMPGLASGYSSRLPAADLLCDDMHAELLQHHTSDMTVGMAECDTHTQCQGHLQTAISDT
jgi:hypothetical protein